MAGFPSTVWTTIRNAGEGRPTAEAEFVALYRPAIVRFVASRGVERSEAEDVAQEVFLRVFEDAVLERADKERGRFRSLLLAITRHVLGNHFEHKRAKKRGGGQPPASLDRSSTTLAALAAPAEPDAAFDREWLAALLEAALRRLERENESYYSCLHAFLVGGQSHREIAAASGKTEASVNNAIARGRARLGRLLREQIAAYSSSGEEFEEEIRLVRGLLKEGPG
jgi:RNA polymerase sigma-70 factor (ECF subfamily)